MLDYKVASDKLDRARNEIFSQAMDQLVASKTYERTFPQDSQ